MPGLLIEAPAAGEGAPHRHCEAAAAASWPSGCCINPSRTPLFTRFDDIIENLQRYDCSFFAGGGEFFRAPFWPGFFPPPGARGGVPGLATPKAPRNASDAAPVAEPENLGPAHTPPAWEHEHPGDGGRRSGPRADGPDRS